MADKEIKQAQFTIDDLMSLLKQINDDNQANMKAMVAEMKKPTAAEQAKLDKEEALLKRKAEIRRAEMINEEKVRLGRQQGCVHKKKARNGAFISAWGGQVCSDGYWYPICTQCQKVGPEVKAPIEWIRGGVNAGDAENPIFAALDLNTLYEWQKRTGGPKPKVKPIGWTEAEKKELTAV